MSGDETPHEVGEVKAALSRRSHHQGAVRTKIKALTELMQSEDKDLQEDVQDSLISLTEGHVKYEEVHQETVAVLNRLGISCTDIDSKASTLRMEVGVVQDEVETWLMAVGEEDTTIRGFATSSPSHASHQSDLSDVSNITSIHAGNVISSTGLDMKSSVSDNQVKQAEIEYLRAELGKLQREKDDDIQILRNKLSRTEDDARARTREQDEAVKQYRRLADSLQQKLDSKKKSEEIRQSAGNADPSLSKSMMTPDDIFALSHVMAKSSSDMMKEMLEHSQQQQKDLVSNIGAPKAKLITFDGDLTKYQPFISRFDEQVGKTNRSNAAKLSTLFEHCSSDVQQHIDCCNYKTSDVGYAHARKILKDKYGSPFLVAQAWVDRLMDYPKLKSTELMVRFAAELSSAKDTLETMGFISELECTRSMKSIAAKLPTYVQNRWRTLKVEREDEDRVAGLADLLKIVNLAAREMSDPIYGPDVLSKVTVTAGAGEPAVKEAKPGKKKSSTYTVDSAPQQVPEAVYQAGASSPQVKQENGSRGQSKDSTGPKPVCFICKKEHYTSRCFQYRDLGAYEKLQFVDKYHLCQLCLYPGHDASKCKMTWGCQVAGCTLRHNSSLHRALVKDAIALPQPKATGKGSSKDSAVMSGEVISHDLTMLPVVKRTVSECVYTGYRYHGIHTLPIVSVAIYGPKGGYGTHALIDTGAAITMCSPKIQHECGLVKVAHSEISIHGISGVMDISSDVLDFQIGDATTRDKSLMSTVIVNPSLNIGREHVEERRRYHEWDHLKDVPFDCQMHDRVEMIIGQDNAYFFQQQDAIYGKEKYSPYGVLTRLGWTVFGHFMEGLGRYECMLSPVVPPMDIALERQVESMWEIDKVPECTPLSPNDRMVEKLWDDSHEVRDGRFYIPIPFKKEPPCFPNNYGPVKARLDSLGRRLKKNPELLEQFVLNMRRNFELGYAEICDTLPDVNYRWYIPQHAVFNDRKPGKCRIVGNASFVFKEACLNLSVHQGPNYANNLVSVLIGFREFEVVVTGDIQAMYNQVKVPEHQRDALRFLWWKDDDPDGEVVEARMQTQMFGGIWSPSAALYSMQKAADMYEGQYDQIVIEAVRKRFYVDDLLKSVMSVAIGLKLILDLRDLLSKVGFNLVKLGSNKMEVLEGLPSHMLDKPYANQELQIAPDVQDKTLGSSYGPGDDCFGFSIEVDEKPRTRRGVLSTFSSVYDPLGFVGPYILQAKLLIQEICRDGLAWDEALPNKYVERWEAWKKEMSFLSELRVPRWLRASGNPEHRYQLHAFSDASEVGYGSVVYFTVLDVSGEIIHATIVASKSKVAPINQLTIPRLELCAALLSAKLEDSIVRALSVRLLPSIFWTDSRIVLYNVHQQSRTFKTFVANRVARIHDMTNACQWQFVPGSLNIADVVSRGCTSRELIDNASWIRGPAFLRTRSEWPEQPTDYDSGVSKSDIECKMVRKEDVSINMSEKAPTHQTIKVLIEYYSTWTRLITAMCVWRRMVNWIRLKKMATGVFTAEERQRAEYAIMVGNQHISLTSSQKQTRGFAKLFPFQDEGAWRVGGRLMLAELRFEEKHPLVLPRSECAKMYIRYVHARFGHVGVDRTYMEIRRTYWLLGGKAGVKEVLGKCVFCRKLKGQGAQQIMAPLPKVRIEQGQAPFETVGLDYCGPFYVKVGRASVKRYICVITCLKTRAVHIEPAADLSTSAFLNLLQRFISRRGRPFMIISDNGTNFVGANRELQEQTKLWNREQVSHKLAENQIQWQFNTPLASHHGGVWERMNRTFRDLMVALCKNQALTDDKLATYACLVEEIMNSRPLTTVDEDSQELLPLTPQHLLNLNKVGGIKGSYSEGDTYRRKWKHMQYLADQFWRRWSLGYLRALQRRQKWPKEQDNVKVGEMVFVMDANAPRLEWPLGLVTSVFPGPDGHVRSVQIRMKGSVYERPISKVVRLELR